MVKKFEPIPKVYYKEQIKQGKDANDYDFGPSLDEEEERNLKTTTQSYSQNRRVLETIQEQEGETLPESRPEEAQHNRSTPERISPAGSLNRSTASLASQASMSSYRDPEDMVWNWSEMQEPATPTGSPTTYSSRKYQRQQTAPPAQK